MVLLIKKGEILCQQDIAEKHLKILARWKQLNSLLKKKENLKKKKRRIRSSKKNEKVFRDLGSGFVVKFALWKKKVQYFSCLMEGVISVDQEWPTRVLAAFIKYKYVD